jgi:hypothetical protein
MLDQLMLTPAQRDGLESAVFEYEKNVHLAADYLAGRGITEDAARRFRLGVVVDPLPGHERLVGKVVLPYLTPAGPMALKARCIEGHDCKAVGCQRYDAPPGQRVRMFNAGSLAEGGDVALVVEGEFDAIMGSTVLGMPTAGTPGTTWLDHFSRMFGDFDRVVVVADHDAKEDGSDPGLKHASRVVKDIPGAELVAPPPGLDLTDWLLEYGVDAVGRALGL